MDAFITTLILLAVFAMVLFALFSKKKPARDFNPLPENHRQVLDEYVEFYRALDSERKIEFENRLQQFLSHVRITGVNTKVEDLDRILIGAAALIPIFGFPDWDYINLNEVLLYPDTFNEEFSQEGSKRNTLGVVGSGPYQNLMILSQHELRQGFINKTGKTNTAIHEFAHLVDKTDGSVDGIPEFLLSKRYVLPWLQLMQTEIKKIMSNRSDINPYGATNQAEFFAVAAEYFFERPDLFKDKHPELYELMSTIFRQDPEPELKTTGAKQNHSY